jgi:hypothetical protein
MTALAKASDALWQVVADTASNDPLRGSAGDLPAKAHLHLDRHPDTDNQPLPASIEVHLGGFLRGEQVHKLLGCDGRRRGILSGNETAINNRKRLPVGAFLKRGSEPHQLILDQKWDNVGEVHFFLLTTSKTSRALSFSSFLLCCIPIESGC